MSTVVKKRRSIFNIYVYGVCFITLIGLAIISGILCTAALKTIIPTYTMDEYTYKYYQDNDAFIAYRRNQQPVPCDSINSYCSKPTADPVLVARSKAPESVASETIKSITEARSVAFAKEIESEKRNGVRGIIETIPHLLIFAVLFLTHWRIARKIKEDN